MSCPLLCAPTCVPRSHHPILLTVGRLHQYLGSALVLEMNGADVQNTNEGLFPLSYSKLYLSPSSAPARSGSQAQHRHQPSNQEPSCSSQPTCTSRERSPDAGAPIAAAPHCAAPVQPRGTGGSAEGRSHGEKGFAEGCCSSLPPSPPEPTALCCALH